MTTMAGAGNHPELGKPKKWIAALLGLVLTPAAMLYTGRAILAPLYLSCLILVGILPMVGSAWGAAAGYLSLLLAVIGASHAYLLAAKYPAERPRPVYSRWYGILGAVAGFAALALVTRAFVVEPFRAPSGSMLPTIPVRAVLVVQKWGYGNYGSYGLSLLRTSISSPVVRGDLVVFEFPSNRSVSYVKRIVGLPGDKIARQGKRLFINGQAVPLRPAGDYCDPDTHRTIPRFVESLPGHDYSVLIDKGPDSSLARNPRFPFAEKCTYAVEEMACEVPAGHFFMLGDNRDNSSDSRMWGFVPASHLVGRVVLAGS